jgi:hypothetical protein
MAFSRMPRLTRTLLFLIRVKRSFLRSQILDQLFDPVNRELIIRGRNPEIPFNPLVQLGALVTHSSIPPKFRREQPNRRLCLKTGTRYFVSRV